MESEEKLTKEEMLQILEQDFHIFVVTLSQQPHLLTIKDDTGRTLLHWSAYLKKKRLVEYLLTISSVSINAADDEGTTPLMVAVVKGNKKIVKMLLENGASIHKKDKSGRTALFLAS